MDRASAERKLLNRVVRRVDGDCWEWQGAKSQGYGFIIIDKKHWLTHRLSYFLFKGELADRKCVCHRCDNPSCCNPTHLFLGTHKDNAIDRSSKRRGGFGERNGNAKLTDKQVTEIRLRYEAQYGQMSELAKEFGVSTSQIRQIIRGTSRVADGEQVEIKRFKRTDNRPPRSEEIKARIRESLKGRKRPQEVVDKIRKARWGK